MFYDACTMDEGVWNAVPAMAGSVLRVLGLALVASSVVLVCLRMPDRLPILAARLAE